MGGGSPLGAITWQVGRDVHVMVWPRARRLLAAERHTCAAPRVRCPRSPDLTATTAHVTHHRLRSRSSAVKLGSESVADMRHISFARLSIADSHRALAIQLR